MKINPSCSPNANTRQTDFIVTLFRKQFWFQIELQQQVDSSNHFDDYFTNFPSNNAQHEHIC